MQSWENPIPLKDEEFRLLRDLIRERCGIFFDDEAKFIIEGRLSRRIGLLQLNDFRDYYRFLLYDKNSEEEFTNVIELLTVNETFFFREQNQLRAFSEEILPELREANSGRKRIRIWSAGCSTGEEPYTIAMLILEYGLLAGWDIEIVASDINKKVLAMARRGMYRKISFRMTDEYFVKKYFTEEAGFFSIAEKVKSFVNFSYLNLLDSVKIRIIEPMDVIFCRNVLIYFNQEAKKKVVGNFHDRLMEGRYLLLGHSESLMNISTSFTLKHLKNDMVYQKPFLRGACVKC